MRMGQNLHRVYIGRRQAELTWSIPAKLDRRHGRCPVDTLFLSCHVSASYWTESERAKECSSLNFTLSLASQINENELRNKKHWHKPNRIWRPFRHCFPPLLPSFLHKNLLRVLSLYVPHVRFIIFLSREAIKKSRKGLTLSHSLDLSLLWPMREHCKLRGRLLRVVICLK